MGNMIVKLATEMWEQFEQGINTEGNKYWKLKDGKPEWMQDVVRKAHDNGDMLPNDFRYEYITDALIKFSEADEDSDDDDLDQLANEGGEPDLYNDVLLKWVGSNQARASYVNEAMEEGSFKDLWALLQAGQEKEMEEVYRQVLEGLREYAETLDDEDDGEGDE